MKIQFLKCQNFDKSASSFLTRQILNPTLKLKNNNKIGSVIKKKKNLLEMAYCVLLRTDRNNHEEAYFFQLHLIFWGNRPY